MKKLFLFLTFVFGNLTVLTLSFLLISIKTTKESSAQESAQIETITAAKNPYPQHEPISVLGASTEAKIIPGDAAVALVENFLQKYDSPMVGLGDEIVTSARKYQIPFGLLPAIGQCEGNLGKSIPADSFNTWGYAIYGSQIKRFASWQAAIEAVSAGIRHDYFDLGLTTPETMMPKYAPPSDGSWARCVNKFLLELQ